MKALIKLLSLLLLSHFAYSQEYTDLKVLRYKGRVKQVKIITYQYYLETDPPDSELRTSTITNFDENGNILSQESESFSLSLTSKTVFKYSDGKKTGYESSAEGLFASTGTYEYKEPYKMNEIIESGNGKKYTKTYIYDKDYRIIKVYLSGNKYAEYAYDDVDDIVKITTIEDGEVQNVDVAQTQIRDPKGNPVKVNRANKNSIRMPYSDYYTFTYY